MTDGTATSLKRNFVLVNQFVWQVIRFKFNDFFRSKLLICGSRWTFTQFFNCVSINLVNSSFSTVIWFYGCCLKSSLYKNPLAFSQRWNYFIKSSSFGKNSDKSFFSFTDIKNKSRYRNVILCKTFFRCSVYCSCNYWFCKAYIFILLLLKLLKTLFLKCCRLI